MQRIHKLAECGDQPPPCLRITLIKSVYNDDSLPIVRQQIKKDLEGLLEGGISGRESILLLFTIQLDHWREVWTAWH